MRGKTLRQFNATPVPAPPKTPRGTTTVTRQDVLVEAARNVVQALQRESSVLPVGVRDAVEAVTDALRAHDRAVAAPPGLRDSDPPRGMASSAPPPAAPIPAGDMEAWWQIRAETRVGQPTRYLVRWAEPTGDGHFLVREAEKDSVSDCLTTVLRPTAG